MKIKSFTGPDIPEALVLGVGVKDAEVRELFRIPEAKQEELVKAFSDTAHAELLEMFSAMVAALLIKLKQYHLTVPHFVMEQLKNEMVLLVSVDQETGDVEFTASTVKEKKEEQDGQHFGEGFETPTESGGEADE